MRRGGKKRKGEKIETKGERNRRGERRKGKEKRRATGTCYKQAKND